MWGLEAGSKHSNLWKVPEVKSVSAVLNYQWGLKATSCMLPYKKSFSEWWCSSFLQQQHSVYELCGSCITHSLSPCCLSPLWFASAVETGTAESACWWNCSHTSQGGSHSKEVGSSLYPREKMSTEMVLQLPETIIWFLKTSETERGSRSWALVVGGWSHQAYASLWSSV